MPELLIKLHLLYRSNDGRLQSLQLVCINCSSARGAKLLSFLEHGLHTKGCLIVNGALHTESRVSMLNLEAVIFFDCVWFEAGVEICASPILWALLNQLLLAALGEKFSCFRVVAIDGEEEHIRPGDSFIDDTMPGSTND
jgi:hypothetical protein